MIGLSGFRLKKLDTGYPPFDMDPVLFEVVSHYYFLKIEVNRMPMLIGSQFGIYPRVENVFDYSYKGYIAILNKSLLSGSVSGLSIYYLSEHRIGKAIFTCLNQNGVNQELDVGAELN